MQIETHQGFDGYEKKMKDSNFNRFWDCDQTHDGGKHDMVDLGTSECRGTTMEGLSFI